MTPWMNLPKAELHVHLEGSFSLKRALELANKQKSHPWKGLCTRALTEKLNTKSFPEFLEQFKLGYRLLQSSRDYQMVTEDLLSELQRQNTVAADIIYSPGVAFQLLGLSLHDIHSGIEAGLRQFPNMKVRLILDTVLNLGVAFMERTLNAVLSQPPSALAGFSIGGGNPHITMEPFLFLFEKAQKNGLFCVAHSGEVDPPENTALLLRETDLVRIAHGLNTVKSPELLKAIQEKQIVMDLSLSSNLKTGVCKKIEEHPIIQFHDWHIPFTINTDDPFYFQTTLINEYQLAEKLLGKEGVERARRLSLKIFKKYLTK
ncbi:MAG: hypothetical protein CR997_11920 [Acidobacteria bacterium]|nr:MAG: hypothetical protein CR997_11920 [Acidobacteriota bacterium]